MGFQQGLSGLKAASKSLEAIGNNVANSQTVGFKASQAQFSDVYANSLAGGSGAETGLGVSVSKVAQQFTQGNVTSSNNPLDIAINGEGFFRMNTNGNITYTRNGQFQLDKAGFIVGSSGAHLSGFAADANGVLVPGAPVDLKISASDLPPKQTPVVRASVNLDSRIVAPESLTPAGVRPPFAVDDPLSYDSATSISIFDSLGNSHVLQTYFTKTATANVWSVYGAVDGAALGTTPVTTLTFTQSGILSPVPDLAALPPVSIVLTPANGSVTPIDIGLNFTDSTQFGSNYSVNKLSQDGYASGRLSGFNTSADGTIVGRYTNGQSLVMGQIAMGGFANQNGLQPLGGNMFAATASSGPALVNKPGSATLGVLQASAVEDSNVDLTAELVNMITAQRYYQANSQTIKTEDQILQTLINLR